MTKIPEAELERYMFNLVNQERTVKDLRQLQRNPKLTAMAKQHSESMRSIGFFDHHSPVRGYETLLERVQRVGFNYAAIGENIHLIYSPTDDIDYRWVELSMHGGSITISTTEHRYSGIVTVNHTINGKGLMHSPGHRANILRTDFQLLGVGISCGYGTHQNQHTYGMWATQVFGNGR